MSRRSRATKRLIVPEAKYGNRLMSMFINKLMVQGRKSLAERIMYQALDKIEAKEGRDPVELFEQAVQNATPVVEVSVKFLYFQNNVIIRHYFTQYIFLLFYLLAKILCIRRIPYQFLAPNDRNPHSGLRFPRFPTP